MVCIWSFISGRPLDNHHVDICRLMPVPPRAIYGILIFCKLATPLLTVPLSSVNPRSSPLNVISPLPSSNASNWRRATISTGMILFHEQFTNNAPFPGKKKISSPVLLIPIFASVRQHSKPTIKHLSLVLHDGHGDIDDASIDSLFKLEDLPIHLWLSSIFRGSAYGLPKFAEGDFPPCSAVWNWSYIQGGSRLSSTTLIHTLVNPHRNDGLSAILKFHVTRDLVTLQCKNAIRNVMQSTRLLKSWIWGS